MLEYNRGQAGNQTEILAHFFGAKLANVRHFIEKSTHLAWTDLRSRSFALRIEATSSAISSACIAPSHHWQTAC